MAASAAMATRAMRLAKAEMAVKAGRRANPASRVMPPKPVPKPVRTRARPASRALPGLR